MIRPQRGIIEHNDFVAAKILTDLKKILNKHKATMINFLKSVCRVSEMHPTMEGFNDTDGTEEVESRLDRLFKEKDNIFKKNPENKENEYEGNDNVQEGSFELEDNTSDDRYVNVLIEKIIETATVAVNNHELDDTIADSNDETESQTITRVPKEYQVDESVEEEDSSIFSSFVKVLTVKNAENLLKQPGKIITTMEKMHLKSREKGSISREQKFKSLTGRWFSLKKEKLEEKPKVIERGSVITLDENNQNEFLVMAVINIHSTKYHLCPNNDNPAWPIVKKEVDKYRLTIRKVDVENGDSGGHSMVSIKDYASLQDGVNIQETYKLVN